MDGAAHSDPSWAALRAHSSRLLRRARRHVWVVFGVAALATLATLGIAARRPVRHLATTVLRMTEDLKAPIRLPWTDRALRGYVSEVAFSQTQLLALIDRHRMFRGGRNAFDPIAAVELLRERITIEVIQNHAIALVDRDNRPRSAHVNISYQDGDPGRAMKIAGELGQLVVATGRSQQTEQEEAAVRLAAADAQAAHSVLYGLRLQMAGAAALQAPSSADVLGLSDAVRLAEARVYKADETLAAAERRVRGETDQSGLDIQLVDTLPSPAPWPVAKKLAVVAVAASLLCFPLAALMVGAWDRRIYASEDVLHLGLRSLGHLGLTRKT